MNTGMLTTWIITFFSGSALWMWPLLLLSVGLFSLCLHITNEIRAEKNAHAEFLKEFKSSFREEDKQALLDTCMTNKGILSQCAYILVQNAFRGHTLIGKSIHIKKQEFFTAMKRNIPRIVTLINLGPVLGFLGTIQGAMTLYLSQGPTNFVPGELDALLGTAFLTSVFGLLLALFGILALNVIQSGIADLEGEFDSNYRQIESMIFIEKGNQNDHHQKKAA